MNIINKLINSFTEDLTHEDQAQLDAWKGESEANLQAIQEFSKIHQASETLQGYESFDTSEAWNKIVTNINPSDEKKLFTIPTLIKSFAAIFIIGLAAFFLIKSNLENSEFQTYVTESSSNSFTLVDGTAIILDNNSTLTVVEDRYVELDGRAKFNVTTTPDVKNFTIKIKNGRITVLGTQFTVLSTNDLLEISVLEGHVKVDYDGRSLDLYANDVMKSFDNQLVVTPDNYKNTNSWSNNSLVFDNDPLSKVLKDISIHFKQKIIFDKSITDASNCPFTSSFTNPKIEDVLDELKTIFKAEIIKQADTYVIVSINC